MSEFKKGDTVTWKSHGSTAHGHVEKTITKTTTVSGHTAKATKGEPQYIVESDKGGKAAHKAGALSKA